MSHDSEPTADYVVKFAKQMETYWQNQSAADILALALLNMTNPVTPAVAGKKSTETPKSLRTGLLAQQNDRDAAIISIKSFIKFNPPNPSDQEERDHASFLEATVNSALLKSGYDATLARQISGSNLDIGRSWTKLCYDPTIWADKHMTALAEKKEKLAGADDVEGAKAVTKEMEAYRRDNWPLYIEYVPARNTWSTKSGLTGRGKRHLPEVVEIRKMSCSDIRNSYDKKCDCGEHSTTDHDVYVYGNHQWEMTVLKDAVELHKFHHALGKSQYTVENSIVARDNDRNIFWSSTVYAIKDLADTLDQLMSDWRTNTHENARAHLMQVYDHERDEGNLGRPADQPIEPGGTSTWWLGEDLRLAPTAALTEQHQWFMTFVDGFLKAGSLRSAVSRGETKSGDPQTLFASAIKMAERDLEPIMAARRLGDEDRADTVMRCVVAINKDYPDNPDPLIIYDRFKGQGALKLYPKDVIGWYEGIQARAERAYPADRNQDMDYAQGLLQFRVPVTDILEELGKEDPDAIVTRGLQEQLKLAMFDQIVVPAAIQRSSQRLMEAPPNAQQQIASQAPKASQPVQNLLAQALQQPAGPVVDGTDLQAAANGRRSGVPQAPQMPMEDP